MLLIANLGHDLDAESSCPVWYQSLRRRGHQRLLLAIPGINTAGEPPDRYRFGFINPVDWYLFTDASPVERWTIRKVHDDPHRVARRPWRLEGVGSDAGGNGAFAPLELDVPATLDEALDEIIEALTAIRSSALRLRRDEWISSFDRALRIARGPLDGVSPDTEYQGGLVPHNWSTPDARRLVSASYACDVFGGMGTWNDGPNDPGRSERLFRAMLTGLAAALNV